MKLYFLYHSSAFWPSWDSLWEAAQKDADIQAKLIYCPVVKQNKGVDGQFADPEQFLLEKNIPYLHYNYQKLIEDKPDFLIIQTPYETFHRKKELYTSELLKQGIKTIYISYGLEFTNSEKANLDHFKLDFFRHLYKIFSYSHEIVEDYSTYAGLQNSICLGHPKFDSIYKNSKIQLDKDLRKRIRERPVLLWHPHFPVLYSVSYSGMPVLSTFSWDDNKELLLYLIDQKDIFSIFMPHHMFFGVFNKNFNVSFDEILSFQRKIYKAENMLFWRGEYPQLLANADIYLGERSALTMEASLFNKPIIYLESNPEIYNSFGKSALKTFEIAQDAEQAIKCINKYKNDAFPIVDRKDHFRKYFEEFYDGNCGLRILNYLKSVLSND